MLKNGIVETYQRVILKCGTTDLRCGKRSLIAMLMFIYGINDFEVGTLYLFCARSCKQVKGLLRTDKGFMLLNIMLETNKVQWIDGSELREVTAEELERIIQGKSIE